METVAQLELVFETIVGYVWGIVLVSLLVGTGVFLTFRLGFIQFRRFGHAFYLALVQRRDPDAKDGDITNFQALMTALSATVGTGNIVGVALALTKGGPGALFWMWVTGFVGMATKYAEAVLAVHYRQISASGEMSGGPMYYLANGIPWKNVGKVLAIAFAVFGTIASFGIGNMTQANSVTDAVRHVFASAAPPEWVVGLILALLVAIVVLGGIKTIGRVTEVLVPFMIVGYLGAALIAIAISYDQIVPAFELILQKAFALDALEGGAWGAAIKIAIEQGVRRGLFSNESGLGSSPIAAAAAKTKHPVSQALVSMTQTFIDTLVVCTCTGLVIIMSGVLDKPGLEGIEITLTAFSSVLGPGGGWMVALAQALFAYSTLLGWSYYGEKCLTYFAGEQARGVYRGVFVVLCFLGAIFTVKVVWHFSDIFNGLMAFPNLIGLILLSGVAAHVTKQYFEKRKA